MIAPKVTFERPMAAVYALHEQKRTNNEIMKKMMIMKAETYVCLLRFERAKGAILIPCKSFSVLPQLGHIRAYNETCFPQCEHLFMFFVSEQFYNLLILVLDY